MTAMRKIIISCAILLGLTAQLTTFAGPSALAGQLDRTWQGQRSIRAGAVNPDYYAHRKYYRHERVPNGQELAVVHDNRDKTLHGGIARHDAATNSKTDVANLSVPLGRAP
jgi:hypothetical protein